LGTTCPPKCRTGYEKTRQEYPTLDRALGRARGARGPAAARKRGAPPSGSSAGPYARAHERLACPYPGMIPFRAEDARFFYGRESEIQQMLKYLRQRRWLFVVGAFRPGETAPIPARPPPAPPPEPLV